MPAFRQVALKYPRQITDWEAFYFLGFFLVLCIVGATAHMQASKSLLLWTMQHVSVNF